MQDTNYLQFYQATECSSASCLKRKMEPLSAQNSQKSKHKFQRPLSELLHEQQEPFILEEFLSERQHLHKRHPFQYSSLTRIDKRASNARKARSVTKSARVTGQHSKVGACDPVKHSFSLRLDSSTRSRYKVSSPVRSPLKSPVNPCMKSPSRSAARLMEAAVRILEPGFHTCSKPRPSFSFSPQHTHMPKTTVRYLLELDHKANQSSKRSKRLRRTSINAQLDLSPYAEEHLHTSNIKSPLRRNIETSHCEKKKFHRKACSQHLERECEIVGDQILSAQNTYTSNAWHKASEALISAFRLSPAKDLADGSSQRRGSSLVHYSKLFSFNKDKKQDRMEEQNKIGQGQGHTNAKYSLLKSILRRLAPAKESIKAKKNGLVTLQNLDPVDKPAARRSLSMKPCPKGSDQSRIRICDIVRWNSFEESEFQNTYTAQTHSRNSLPGERCISLEYQGKTYGDVMVNRCLSSKDEKKPQKRKVARKGTAEYWQAFLKRRKDVSSDFSSTTSTSAWLESSLDSDSGSTSLDLLPSTSRSSNSDSRDLKGIDHGTSEESCTYGYFSLEIDENGKASDFHQSPRHTVIMPFTKAQGCDTVCDRHEGSAAPNESIIEDLLCGSAASITSTMNLTRERNAEVSSANFKFTSTEIEEAHEYIPSKDNLTRDECSWKDNSEVSDSGGLEEVEQLSPVSVLGSPFEEDTPSYEQSLATIQRARKQLLKKISDYEKLAYMDPFVLENRIASWKESSSEDETGSCVDYKESDRMDDMYADVSCQTSPSRSYQDEEEMDWDGVNTEDYVREVLSGSPSNADDPTTSTWDCHHTSLIVDGEMQEFGGSSCYLQSKQVSMKQTHCKLLLDRVDEELQSTGHGTSGLMVEPWLKEQRVHRISGQVSAWKEDDTIINIDKLVELDLKREGEEWKMFREEHKEIGIKIELSILGLLVEEVLVDLVQV